MVKDSVQLEQKPSVPRLGLTQPKDNQRIEQIMIELIYSIDRSASYRAMNIVTLNGSWIMNDTYNKNVYIHRSTIPT